MSTDELSKLQFRESRSALVEQVLGRDRYSASRPAAIVDSSVNAILGQTADGRITSWNFGAEQMYGYKASEAIGRDISLLFPPDAVDERDAASGPVAHGGLVERRDTRRVCKDGTVLDVFVTITPTLDSNGVITEVSVIGRDVTLRMALDRERKLLNARLNQAERMESIGRLTGGIVHDFNNLLAVILNYSAFVAQELDDKDAAVADLEQIRQAAELASELATRLFIAADR